MIENEEYEVRILPKNIQFSTDMVIFEDTIALFAYDDELTIIKIENKNFSDTFRMIFESLWANAKKTK